VSGGLKGREFVGSERCGKESLLEAEFVAGGI